MKGKWISRGLALGLTLAMALGLSACGGDGKSMENAGMAKENVYRISRIDMPELTRNDKGWTNIAQTMHKDGRIYVLIRVEDYDEVTYESVTSYNLLSMDEDGGNQKMTKIELPYSESGGGEGEILPEVPIVEDPETEAEELPDAADMPEEDEAAADIMLPEEPIVDNNVWESESYSDFVLNSDGDLYGLKCHSREEYVDDRWNNERSYYVCRWDDDGKFLWEKEVEAILSNQDEWLYVSQVLARPDGTLELLVSGDSVFRVTVDAQGNASDRKPLPDSIESIFNNMERMVSGEDGRLLLIYRDENDWQKFYCADYDPASGELGEPKSLPSSIFYAWDYNVMNVRANGDLLFTTSGGVYTYTMGDDEIKPLMDYINSDIFINYFSSIVELSDTSFVGIYSEEWGADTRAGIFQYVNPADIMDKAVIVLAGDTVSYDMKKRVIEYNQSSEDYRVVIREYNIYDTYDDYNAGMTKLNNDIISGNMPDILVNNEYNSLPIENYIAKGWIADVNKLIAGDEELSQKEFIQSVFDAYSVNGKLYYVVPNFEVYTVIAKKALVGDRTSWTLEDMQQVLAQMGEGTSAFGNEITRDGFIRMVMRYCGNQFMDVSTGKCSFDSEDFIAVMEFAKTLPEEIDYDEDYWMTYDWSAEQSQYREDRTLMMQANFYYFQNITNMINGYFGEPVSYCGFPTGSGSGAYIQSSRTCALAAKSKNLDGAWEFVRYYLTDEYQKEVNYFPVNKELFYERSQVALERPYWEDENGEKQYYDNTMYINGEEIPVPPLSQEQLDELTEYIFSVNNRYYYNEAITNIVSEEMGGFFTGQKSAQDVAGVIQSRAQIYVDENR